MTRSPDNRSEATGSEPTGADPQAKLLLTMVLLAFTGQMMLNPVIAPLSRAMGLREWQIGATVSAAALALVLLSRFWGRRSQRIGVKPTLVLAMAIACIGLTGFALVAWWGVRGDLSGTTLFAATLATRGLVYGAAIAAVVPAVQAHLVARAASESERVRAVGGLGAAQGAASIVGAVVGGVLAALGGLLLPVALMPAAMLAGLLLLLLRFRGQAPEALVEEPAAVSPRDARVLPFLIAGFLLFLGFSAVATLIGFAVQDRFGFGPDGTAAVTAVLLIATSIVMAVVQGGVASKLGWSARTLLAVGFAVLVAGGVLLVLSAPVWVLGLGCVLIGLGSGLAMPGYTAGPTLGMSREEQVGVAGLVGAVNGLTYVIAPIGSTTLYGLSPTGAFVGVLALFATGLAVTLLHPTLRPVRTGSSPPR